MIDADEVSALKKDLAIANHVLFQQGVLDGNGHISVRSPQNPDHLLISRALPPGLVTEADIVELDFEGNPVGSTPRDVRLYSERALHCEIYRARPDINSIVHSHAPASVSFSVMNHPLKPIFHIAAFLNDGPPIFDPSKEMESGYMMIRGKKLAMGLAERLADQDVLLIRGHGSVVTGKNIPIMAMRAMHLENNAEMLLKILATGATEITYLTSDDIRLQRIAEDEDIQWRLWQIYKYEEEKRAGQSR